MPRWLTTTLDAGQAGGLRVLPDSELPVDDSLRETLLERLTYAMRKAGMALAPEGPDLDDAPAATQSRLDMDRWIDEGGSLGAEATGLSSAAPATR